MLIKILLKYILGYVKITVEGYYIERFINICTTNKILIWNLKREKGVKLHLNIGIQDFYRAVKVAKKLKCKVKIEKKRGIPFLINKYRKRKIFLISLIIIIMSLYISSNFVWNIDIHIEENAQMENLEQDIKEAGLEIGKSKSKINTQEIVNKIRLKRKDVSWIGISLKGTNAIVKAVKAKEAPEIIDEKDYCNIVAKKSGTITQIIAQNGTAQVKIGDQVQEGQILIQGIMEGKYTGIRYVHSLGEAKAIVQYTKTGQYPLKEEQKIKTGNKENKYGIKINNFQINFYKTLSKFKIYDTIEEEKKFKIFSNLYLPISVIKLTNEELENFSKEYTIEEITEKGTKQLEEEIEAEIEEKENILRKKCNSNRNGTIYRNNCDI
ncbi:MAG: sporulation protein YqfD [Clostridia bacterium]|nr:sporulation protein YqfD [Clostridia bacterium]